MKTINLEMISVVSSNVIAVGYKDNKLYVDFASGRYEYDNVPKEIYDNFLTAESKGKYMWKYVRGKYEYRRILPVPAVKQDIAPLVKRYNESMVRINSKFNSWLGHHEENYILVSKSLVKMKKLKYNSSIINK